MYLPVGLDEFQLETRRIYSQITIERATKVMNRTSFFNLQAIERILKDHAQR